MINRPVESVRFRDAIAGINTVIFAFSPDLPVDQFEYHEVISVSAIMASAPPVDMPNEVLEELGYDLDDDEDDDQDDDDGSDQEDESNYWRPTMDRPSALIERELSKIGLSEPPTFGRRLLLVSYNPKLDEGEIERVKQRARKRLGQPLTVWQGRSFEGYCFIDNAVPERIISQFCSLLDSDEVADYLLVQPISMVKRNKSGLSPLGDWLDGGWRTPNLSRFDPNDRAHKTSRRGQRS
jgi:hypothetical protein